MQGLLPELKGRFEWTFPAFLARFPLGVVFHCSLSFAYFRATRQNRVSKPSSPGTYNVSSR